MKKDSPIVALLVIIILFAGIAFMTYVGDSKPADQSFGSDASSGFVKAATSTNALISTSSTLLTATTTGRLFGRISSPYGTIYCNMDNGKAAVAKSGIAIATGTSYIIGTAEDNLYRGSIFCISDGPSTIATYYGN